MKITEEIKLQIKNYLNVKSESGQRFQRALAIIESTNGYCFHKSSDYLFNTRRNKDFRSKYERCERFIYQCEGGKYTYYSFLFYDKKQEGEK